MQYLVAVALLGHVGGIPTQAKFSSPVCVNNVADQSFTMMWIDPDEMDPTGRFDFYYQVSNGPPNTSLMSGHLIGTAIPEGQQVNVSDLANLLLWDTSQVPAGSYFIYEVTTDTDMGIPPIHAMAPGVVTVQHPGEPLWPAVVVEQPDGVDDVVGDAFAVKWKGSGVGPLTATVRGKERDEAGALPILASDVPMIDQGDGTFAGCWLWNLSSRPQGYYYVEITVTDASGLTHAAYSRQALTLYRDPNPTDAGPPPSCPSLPGVDAGAGDGGTGGDDEPGPPTCGCRIAGRRAGGLSGAAALAVLVAAARARRRRPARG